jgi:GPH family glycoside/pentoside/hexuronide:cation symporter
VEREATEIVLVLYIVMGAVGFPLWTFLAQRRGKKQSMVLATLLQSVSLFSIYLFVSAGDLAIYLSIVACAVLSVGGIPAMHFIMLGDVADLDQLESRGMRDQGQLTGLLAVSRKVLAAVCVAIAFNAIDAEGYTPNIIQSQSVKLTIRVCYALIPGLLTLLSVIVLVRAHMPGSHTPLCAHITRTNTRFHACARLQAFYPLNKETHARVLDSLKQQRASEEKSDTY